MKGKDARNIRLSLLLFLLTLLLGFARLKTDIFYSYDIYAITFLQSFHSPLIDFLMHFFSTLADEMFLILFACFIYWYGTGRKGIVYVVVFIVSVVINFQAKNLFSLGRPSPSESQILAHETTPGFPSNHAQNGIFVFSFLVFLERRLRLSLILGFLVGVSRVYLGVHYMTDVLGGWMMGGAFFLLTKTLVSLSEEGRFDRLFDKAEKRLASSFLFFFFIYVFGLWEFRIKVPALALGIFSSLSFMDARWGFISWRRFLTASILGGACVVVLRFGLKFLFPQSPPFDFLRYVIIGASVAWLPLLFLRCGLLERKI